MTEKRCEKCNGIIKKSVEVAAMSEDRNFVIYNYFWDCPCGYSNDSDYGVE